MLLQPRLLVTAWFALGLIFAVSRDYLGVDTLKEIASAILAVLLWPLLLLGIDLHVR